MLITYDDGDSEDFDLKWLKEGRALYHKYRHKDPLLASKAKTKTKVSSTATASKKAATTRHKDPILASKAKTKPNVSSTATSSKNGLGLELGLTWKPGMRFGTRRLYPDAHYREMQKKEEMEKRRKETEMEERRWETELAEISKNAHRMVLEKRRKETEMNEIRNQIQVAVDATTAQEQANQGEATNARRVSDQSSHLNETGNKTPTNNNKDGNESDSSDEVEVVEVRVPYRPNPNLFILPDLAASTINNQINNQINLNNLNNTNIANNYFGGINPYSSFPSYREGFYDF